MSGPAKHLTGPSNLQSNTAPRLENSPFTPFTTLTQSTVATGVPVAPKDKKDGTTTKLSQVERGMEGKGSDGEGGESPLTFCLSPTATPAVKTLLKTDHLGTAEGVEEGAVVEIGAEGYGIMEVRQAASFLIFCSIYMLPNAALYDKLTPILVTPLLTLLASLIAAINQ